MTTAAPGRLALRAIPPIALMALIFYLSSREAVDPDLPGWVSIVAHFSEFALLAALWSWALAPALGRRALALAAVIAVLYAISDEYHQNFVEGRDSDPLDVLVDTLGIAAALIAIGRRPTGGRGR